MALFVTVLLVSNIASSAKIVDWGVSIFGLRLAFDAGTILFPISYIFGDVLTEVYGFKQSRRVIWTGFGALALSSLIFWLVRIMPGEATWQVQTGQKAFNQVWGHEHRRDSAGKSGGIPGWRIYQFSDPGKNESAYGWTLAMDAHNRQHPGG